MPGSSRTTAASGEAMAAPGQAASSHQRNTRRARSVFHRLAVPTGPSMSKWTRPGWMRSSAQRPSGIRFDRTISTASSIRGSASACTFRK